MTEHNPTNDENPADRLRVIGVVGDWLGFTQRKRVVYYDEAVEVVRGLREKLTATASDYARLRAHLIPRIRDKVRENRALRARVEELELQGGVRILTESSDSRTSAVFHAVTKAITEDRALREERDRLLLRVEEIERSNGIAKSALRVEIERLGCELKKAKDEIARLESCDRSLARDCGDNLEHANERDRKVRRELLMFAERCAAILGSRSSLSLEQIVDRVDSLRRECGVLSNDRDRLRNENDQLRVQLAGCLTAAEGVGAPVPRDAYGWSVSYQAVVDLRSERDRLRVAIDTLEKTSPTSNDGETVEQLGKRLARTERDVVDLMKVIERVNNGPLAAVRRRVEALEAAAGIGRADSARKVAVVFEWRVDGYCLSVVAGERLGFVATVSDVRQWWARASADSAKDACAKCLEAFAATGAPSVAEVVRKFSEKLNELEIAP